MIRIGPHVAIAGEISSDKDLAIEGRVRGYVNVREATLTIEAPAEVDADLRAAQVVVRGHVRGAIFATGRIELASTATVEGSLSAGRIVIADGAIFNGTVDLDRRFLAARVAEYKAGRK